ALLQLLERDAAIGRDVTSAVDTRRAALAERGFEHIATRDQGLVAHDLRQPLTSPCSSSSFAMWMRSAPGKCRGWLGALSATRIAASRLAAPTPSINNPA